MGLAAHFPLAESYARLLGTTGGAAVRETQPPYRPGFHWSERHLQCAWFDARYRPATFPLPGGETLTVLEPGEWNLEAGPDFLNAALLIQPGARQLRGDVEIHVHPSDWDAHRHADDPAYARVVAHVTWFPGPPPRTLPAAVFPLSLGAPLLARTDLALDDIDLKAYPHAALPATPRPCETLLARRPDLARDLLQAAGQYRLLAKAGRFRARLEQTADRHQLFYEETLAALGYKHNQQPCRALARLVPANTLAALTREAALARLLGAARLLPQPEAAPDDEGRRFIRALWDIWWRNATDPLPEEIRWRLHGLRPQNAPVRRLAAAASLFCGLADVLHDLDRLTDEAGAGWHARALDTLETRSRWPFWNRRLSLSSPPDPAQEVALLGAARAAALLTNVVLPLAAAEEALPPDALLCLPPEDLSAPMRLTALHLFGRDHNPALYSGSGLLQQGLLQIHLDFCLNARPGCDACPLCDALRAQA